MEGSGWNPVRMGLEMESGIIVSPIILTHKKVTNSKSNLLIFLFRNMKLRIIIIFLIVINILAIIILQIFQCYISSVFCMVHSVSQPFCIRYGIAQK